MLERFRFQPLVLGLLLISAVSGLFVKSDPPEPICPAPIINVYCSDCGPVADCDCSVCPCPTPTATPSCGTACITPTPTYRPLPTRCTSTPEPTAKPKCNQGIGNGPEGCDPGNSNHNQPSNDEGSQGRGKGKGHQ